MKVWVTVPCGRTMPVIIVCWIQRGTRYYCFDSLCGAYSWLCQNPQNVKEIHLVSPRFTLSGFSCTDLGNSFPVKASQEFFCISSKAGSYNVRTFLFRYSWRVYGMNVLLFSFTVPLQPSSALSSYWSMAAKVNPMWHDDLILTHVL